MNDLDESAHDAPWWEAEQETESHMEYEAEQATESVRYEGWECEAEHATEPRHWPELDAEQATRVAPP